MKRFLMSSLAAGMALSLIGAPLAMAQQDQHGPTQMPYNSNHGPAPQYGSMQHGSMQHNTQAHPPMQMAHGQNQAPAPMQHGGYASGHQWHSGEHYTGSRNYVSNWNQYHLSRPPAGHQWVRDGSQFVLVAVATGIISSVILNSAR